MKYVVLAIVIALVVFYFTRSANNKKVAVENIAIGKDFLVKNKAIEGVTETASGLQYQVLQKGEGSEHPTARSKVKVHYHGSLIDGTVFDSSVERGAPISFGLNQVIRGWTEGVQLMVVGDKFKFFIPAELGYGNRAAGKIAPGSMLIFEVELLEIQ
ncbi:FKBP-type peptidyl-prolyl cis-trans isomerase [Thalassomonas actiniarum]|uniref:Peptidyl-prolyl cis-trans isomerase n=1 Tax=Thalassomonas actiniarum TaxID=485447 RepID=A0AAE9YWG2_9GAMM|nr:FKBP-type peptidyl-prolyl cis-trans isomerase [Thalassomonas actiniarum]WDE02451.1 FKBP-type peptidyl-prolyl cis-trans isomerase [Thalassomonas actiniarum]